MSYGKRFESKQQVGYIYLKAECQELLARQDEALSGSILTAVFITIGLISTKYTYKRNLKLDV
ncbi:uncharacterized protein LACBIDRAFT_313893 [Laccaria bicolor S238N-H82]|uniref:Predicted protein n=1 Tax=Laccaria bicolor (strain S238N-H82 / ATCC MYA-4686) TaxID=486041 RepID=B0D131_LACBS|nr:uncharacterized protein LACBIDRAFT_313893 [Laccaria bicolor S238N-H82]EDR11561.1 predicted protein [Laccaria bicolor S238N-H82]|eukprot:XP_001877458.1 predicted protein [Laccaria bicolor S238N-H82]